MTSNTAVHYTQVDPDTVMVRCAAPWFNWTSSAASTVPAAARRRELAPAAHGRSSLPLRAEPSARGLLSEIGGTESRCRAGLDGRRRPPPAQWRRRRQGSGGRAAGEPRARPRIGGGANAAGATAARHDEGDRNGCAPAGLPPDCEKCGRRAHRNNRPAGRLRPGVRKDRQRPSVETEWLRLVVPEGTTGEFSNRPGGWSCAASAGLPDSAAASARTPPAPRVLIRRSTVRRFGSIARNR